MTQSSYPVGYGRPPVHTQFQKGHSGNPGGKPGPKRRLKDEFAEALASAFDGTMGELRDARPKRGIEVLARVVALHALEGRSSAQKIVLGLLDGKDRGDTGDSLEADTEAEAEGEDEHDDAESAARASEDDASGAAGERAGEDEDEDEEEEEEEDELTDEDRFKFDFARDMVGDRYDEIKERIERAVNEGDMAALCDAVGEAEEVRIKLAAERKRDAMADGEGQCG
jgi:hypothetical protein